ncbi:hypothetical protein [Methylobacterium sp. Leaf123]|nr:hypothetical protein [Methylobacterium sp. Leaf123]
MSANLNAVTVQMLASASELSQQSEHPRAEVTHVLGTVRLA